MNKVFYLLILLIYGTIIRAQNDSLQLLNKELKKELSEKQKAEKLRQKHQQWNEALLVHDHDTISVRVKPKAEESNAVARGVPDPYYSFNGFTVAYEDDKEKNIYAEDFTTLIIPAKGKYISIKNTTGDTWKHSIYKVIVDGECKLLLPEVTQAYRTEGPGDIDDYYIYYAGSLWLVSEEAHEKSLGNKDKMKFRNTCHEIFVECPTLLEKIDSKALRFNNVAEIVKEFNQCIANTLPVQSKK